MLPSTYSLSSGMALRNHGFAGALSSLNPNRTSGRVILALASAASLGCFFAWKYRLLRSPKSEVEPNATLKSEVRPNAHANLKSEVKPNAHANLKSEVKPNATLQSEVRPNANVKWKLFFDSDTQDDTLRRVPHRLINFLSGKFMDVDLVDPNNYNPADLPDETVVVMVISTKDGKPSSHFDGLVQWLRREAEASNGRMILKRCKFAVFGVGSQDDCEELIDFVRELVRLMRSLGAPQISRSRVGILQHRDFSLELFCWAVLVSDNNNLVVDSQDFTFGCDPEFENDEEYISGDGGYLEGFSDNDGNDDLYECDTGGNDKKLEVFVDNNLYEGDTGGNDKKLEVFVDLYEDAIHDLDRTHLKVNGDELARPMPGVIVQASVFYILLEHCKHKPKADHTLDTLSVPCIYRVEIKDRADDFTERSLGSPVFRFTSNKYPLGMGCGALGSRLFFVGGLLAATNSATEDGPPAREFNNKVYILDTSFIDPSSTHEDIAQIIEIKESDIHLNKYDPIVITAKGKLFVLPNNFGVDGTNPTIESYDPNENKWETFDILENYEGYGSLRARPPLSTRHKVQSCCVKGSVIFICLFSESYAFDMNTGKLYLIGYLDDVFHVAPFHGMGVYVDGCFCGLYQQLVIAFKYNPFVGKRQNRKLELEPDDLLHFYPATTNMQGVITSLETVGEANRMLVVRGSRRTDKARTRRSFMAFDFLSIMKMDDDPTTIWPNHSLIFHIHSWSDGYSVIKACFPMQ